jgi:hypothetical protein
MPCMFRNVEDLTSFGSNLHGMAIGLARLTLPLLELLIY